MIHKKDPYRGSKHACFQVKRMDFLIFLFSDSSTVHSQGILNFEEAHQSWQLVFWSRHYATTYYSICIRYLGLWIFFYLKTKGFSVIYNALFIQPVGHFADGILLRSLDKSHDKGHWHLNDTESSQRTVIFLLVTTLFSSA